jgi:hypothetical protein
MTRHANARAGDPGAAASSGKAEAADPSPHDRRPQARRGWPEPRQLDLWTEP